MRTRHWIGPGLLACLLLAGCEREKVEPVEAVAAPGADRVRAVVGAEGGELRFPGDGARLVVPKDVLQEEISITLEREEPSFDLAGKNFVGRAYRISPRITFAPGAARLYVPVDRELPGLPAEIDLKMYDYGKLRSDGPAGPAVTHTWKPQPLAKFDGYSQDQKHLVFWIYETISDRSARAPFGSFQVGYDIR